MTLVRRLVTQTALSKRHERDPSIERLSRIPFSRFDRDAYHPAAVALAAEAMTALAKGEYLAVDVFAKLTGALTVSGAPFDVLAAAMRAQADELGHAELALRAAETLSGGPVEITIDPAQHASIAGTLSAFELDRAMLHLPAIGESLACAMIAASVDRATDPMMKAVFRGLLRDEVHHARLGWYYLAWRADQWTNAERQTLADAIAPFVMEIEATFGRGRDAPRAARADAKALGVVDSKAQREAVVSVMEDEIVPGLDGLGLGASYAWRARRRPS